jgi:BlaI family transcriptional regulator, penicillinase repressor
LKPKPILADLQLAILKVLWAQREATAADVHAALEPQRGLAPTTIATMLMKLEKKGVVRHYVDGRRFVYQPAVSEQQVRRSMVSELRERLFAGDTTAFVSHLLSEHEIDPEELGEIRRMIASRASAKKKASL